MCPAIRSTRHRASALSAIVAGAALLALWTYLDDPPGSTALVDPWPWGPRGECLGPPAWCRRLAAFEIEDAGAQADAGPAPGSSALDAGAREDALDDLGLRVRVVLHMLPDALRELALGPFVQRPFLGDAAHPVAE